MTWLVIEKSVNFKANRWDQAGFIGTIIFDTQLEAEKWILKAIHANPYKEFSMFKHVMDAFNRTIPEVCFSKKDTS